MKVRWTVEIEFDDEKEYRLETEDPGIGCYISLNDDGISAYSDVEFPWKVVKKEML